MKWSYLKRNESLIYFYQYFEKICGNGVNLFEQITAKNKNQKT